MRISDWSSDVCSSDLVVQSILSDFSTFCGLKFGFRTGTAERTRRMDEHRQTGDESGDDTNDRQHGGIQVIARTSRIMRALSAHPQGLSLGGIAAEVGLPRSTVQRIVTALVAENLLEPAGAAGGFRLGPALGQQIGRAH